jgi:DnaJ-class molecular chaperone
MVCPGCLRPVLVAIVGGETIIAELHEWQPRSRCFPCAGAQATSKRGKVHCSHCDGSGYVGGQGAAVDATTTCLVCEGSGKTPYGRRKCSGCHGSGYVRERRPDEPMLAIDVAWSDEGHIRVIGPNTSRKAGEGLHRLHRC